MEDKFYKVSCYMNTKYIGRVLVEAKSEEEAREKAWDTLETNMYAETVEMTKEQYEKFIERYGIEK